MIKAECIAASICKTKIATFKVTMPRDKLAEFNTHRVFSRNSASSRAIPFRKMVKAVEENPFVPMAWQKDHPGMQGTKYLDDVVGSQLNSMLSDLYKGREILNGIWCGQGAERPNGSALYHMIECATELNQFGATKQIANRLLEPFMYHTVLVTATEWDNFFQLRCPQYQIFDQRGTATFKSRKDAVKYAPDLLANGIHSKPMTDLEWLQINKGQADIHMMAVAEAIYDAWNEADFKQLAPYEWHVPYGDQIDLAELTEVLYKLSGERILIHNDDLMQAVREVSVARCARLSYQTLGDDPKINYEADLRLYNDLRRSGHWSPFEHVAYAMDEDIWRSCLKTIINSEGNFQIQEGWLANFRGWVQTRTILENRV